MKKIGILTFSYGSNYGGTLQCVGLYKFIKKNFDKEIEVINFIPKNKYSLKNLYLLGAVNYKKVDFKKLLIKIRYAKKTIEKFDVFRKKEMKITKIFTEENVDSKIKDYETVIVGSDQVWNVVGGLRETYFLKNIENINKISYAACSGSDFYQESDKEKLKESIEKFNHISVRNNHTYNFVKNLTDKSSEIVCDPSILYDYKEYLNNKKSKEKYILTYILGSEINGGHIKVLEEIKKKIGVTKIIAVGIAYAGSGSLQFYPWADEIRYDLSPEEWLNLINNAEFIYTDSYHGVLFSMKFHKKFLSYYSEKGRASRFIDLAKRYNVEEWIVNDSKEIFEKKSLEKTPNYKEIDKLLEEHRKYSINFLKKALGENNE
ncbi:MAG: polysaccharide pyruvyl transferase family protein [Cetobacterium sp.]